MNDARLVETEAESRDLKSKQEIFDQIVLMLLQDIIDESLAN